ncbi:MAG: dihydrofolate reductase family protein [Pseudomonadota bacterium]
MRDLAVLTFHTLDGVMQAPMMPQEDQSGGFDRGGWAAPFWEEVMAQVQCEAMSVPYDMLLGRITYEAFAAYWPNLHNDPTAERLNAARKYVVSNGSPELSWNNSHLISGNVASEIASLKRHDGPLIQVHGSSRLLRTLFENDLVDEFRLWCFPVVIGSGKRVFETETKVRALSLQRTEQLKNGVVMSIYRKAGHDAP